MRTRFVRAETYAPLLGVHAHRIYSTRYPFKFLVMDGVLYIGDVRYHSYLAVIAAEESAPDFSDKLNSIDEDGYILYDHEYQPFAAGSIDADGKVVSWSSVGLHVTTPEEMRMLYDAHIETALGVVRSYARAYVPPVQEAAEISPPVDDEPEPVLDDISEEDLTVELLAFREPHRVRTIRLSGHVYDPTRPRIAEALARLGDGAPVAFVVLSTDDGPALYISPCREYALIARAARMEECRQLDDMLLNYGLLRAPQPAAQLQSIPGLLAAGRFTHAGDSIESWEWLPTGETPDTLKQQVQAALRDHFTARRQERDDAARIERLRVELSPKLTRRTRTVALEPDAHAVVCVTVTTRRGTDSVAFPQQIRAQGWEYMPGPKRGMHTIRLPKGHINTLAGDPSVTQIDL